MKRIMAMVCAAVLLFALASCGGTGDTISVITREESSGTRSAFVELLEIVDADGNDAIFAGAESTNSTATVLTTVAGDKNAIGYVSLGSLSDTVKALKVDGVEATVANIKNGTYKISRPFNIAYKTDTALSAQAQDFVNYIMSAQGQAIVSEEGYIAVSENAATYTASGATGKITLDGSTSVGPLMEKLAEAYKALNPGVTFSIQQTGSSAGITAAQEGTCDIGMASRELKDSERATLTGVTIAQDGIAVIVNKANTLDGLTAGQIKDIYLGTVTKWSELAE